MGFIISCGKEPVSSLQNLSFTFPVLSKV